MSWELWPGDVIVCVKFFLCFQDYLLYWSFFADQVVIPALTCNYTRSLLGNLFSLELNTNSLFCWILQIVDPYLASYGAESPIFAVIQLAQTTMRSELGKMTLDKTFEERDALNENIVVCHLICNLELLYFLMTIRPYHCTWLEKMYMRYT